MVVVEEEEEKEAMVEVAEATLEIKKGRFPWAHLLRRRQIKPD